MLNRQKSEQDHEIKDYNIAKIIGWHCNSWTDAPQDSVPRSIAGRLTMVGQGFYLFTMFGHPFPDSPTLTNTVRSYRRLHDFLMHILLMSDFTACLLSCLVPDCAPPRHNLLETVPPSTTILHPLDARVQILVNIFVRRTSEVAMRLWPVPFPLRLVLWKILWPTQCTSSCCR